MYRELGRELEPLYREFAKKIEAFISGRLRKKRV